MEHVFLQGSDFVGITFWVVLINGLLYLTVKNNFLYSYIFKFIIVFIFPLVIGYMIYNNLDEINDDYQISMVQPNINLKDSRD